MHRRLLGFQSKTWILDFGNHRSIDHKSSERAFTICQAWEGHHVEANP